MFNCFYLKSTRNYDNHLLPYSKLSPLFELIHKKNKNVSFINNYYEVTKNFYKLTQKGDLILNMGAGDCHNFWSILNEKTIKKDN